MASSIIEKLTVLDGGDKLSKVNPNTQDIPRTEIGNTDKLTQAVIPSVLAGFYKFTRDEEHAAEVTNANHSNWAEVLFGAEQDNLVKRISLYSGSSIQEAGERIQDVSSNVVNLVRQEVPNADGKSIQTYFTAQRNDILHHLPAAIEIGNILNDTTLDDRTNKMSGPVSGLMHGIEKVFAGTDSEDDKKNTSNF
jgi:hypothetical protein